jgi:hydrogenase nickel incorporation protein HypA/HybF
VHELALAESAIQLIEDAARRERFRRARVVHMEIGALSCVDADAFRFAFEAASTGSCAEGARLEIVEIGGEGACRGCGFHAAMPSPHELCPQCGTHALKVLRGTEMRVKDLEVD